MASSQEQSDLIELDNVVKTYRRGDSEVRAVDGVSISFPHAAFTALAGPSGSGKSSLLNILGTIDVPDSGRVILEGDPIPYDNQKRLEALRSTRLGFVFQNFNLITAFTALENVEVPLLPRRIGSGERRERARKALAAVGLSEREHHMPRELSGGQQQRVSVARALVGDPVLVVADEPTANLDSVTAHQLLELMGDLNRDSGTAFLFSTHDQRILDVARHVVHLEDGRLKQ